MYVTVFHKSDPFFIRHIRPPRSLFSFEAEIMRKNFIPSCQAIITIILYYTHIDDDNSQGREIECATVIKNTRKVESQFFPSSLDIFLQVKNDIESLLYLFIDQIMIVLD